MYMYVYVCMYIYIHTHTNIKVLNKNDEHISCKDVVHIGMDVEHLRIPLFIETILDSVIYTSP